MIKLGVIVPLVEDPEEEIRKVAEFGLPTCQLACWNITLYTDESAKKVKDACEKHGVEVSSVWAGYPGEAVWDFIDGPKTIGLVPDETRAERVEALKKGADFAVKIGVDNITSHVGFLPENPNNPVYKATVEALKQVVGHCHELGIDFNFETGQETPVALLRTFEEIGLDNVGINLDPANLLMYGKANPLDALDMLADYVNGVHAKDGEYPTDGWNLGVEKQLGEGRVNFPVLIQKLKDMGYDGALTIEREISGPQQAADIKKGVEFLRKLIAG
jgi:sugar phosphate isomerase/epimerase